MAGDNPVKRAVWRVTIPVFGLFMLLGFMLGDAYFFYRAGPNPDQTAVYIPSGSSLRNVTDILQADSFIDSAATFYWTARLSGAAGDIKAGEFMVPAGASQADILNILREGKVVLHRITIPEGLTSRQVVVLLLQNPALSSIYMDIPEEGTLLPETYFFELGESPAKIIERMRRNQAELLAELWDNYDFSLPFTSPEEAVIIASIVERETAIPEERGMIAAVFLNRLAKRMRLQSDPTVIYGLTGGEPLGRPIRQSELERDTPYNTYVHYGLPAGPIANPGEASLRAVFNPAPSDALYFVADGSGGHVFSDTLEEHNKNVAKWRKFQRDGAGD